MKRILTLTAFLLTVSLRSQVLNYYYGNLHSHSGYSDGNKDSSSSGCSKPYQDYAYAKLSQHFDFLGIAEHNHYSSGNPGMQLPQYASGLSQATSATQPGTFLALYGMEWGVSSSTNGHIIIYGFNQLIGWETGNYNIYNDKVDYDGIFKKVKNNSGAFCYLAHPYTTDFKYLAVNPYNATYDSAICGVPFRSGIYNTTTTSYSDYPLGDYMDYYMDLLKIGYHIGIGYDHDNHNTTFGRNNGGRLVIVAPALTIPDLYTAMQNMHFYGSDDWNAAIDFKIGTNIMGDIMNGSADPVINVVHNDGDSELADSIKIWSGVPGSGALATVAAVSKSMNTLSFTDNSLSAGATKYYFVEIRQADGQRIVTSPIWYTKNATAIKEENKDLNFVMFPNPASSEVHISTGVCADYFVEITDISGRSVYSNNYNDPDLSIDVRNLSKGFYTIRITGSGFSGSKKLLIE